MASRKAQPPVNEAYKAEGNAVTSNPVEQRASHTSSHQQQEDVATRGPSSKTSMEDAIPQPQGRGTHGAPARQDEGMGKTGELDGDQMRAPGEGQVADVVERKPGASGSQPDLASDLDRKKREQAAAREAIQEKRKHGEISSEAGGGVDVEQDKMF
ncbi:hypothetical protein GGS20DRAFT_541568 [Poronia punctata]|nr:hypothetical protein GGS20DRAFT_541568 [Poronia punctata]